jgi:hypothetical protein
MLEMLGLDQVAQATYLAVLDNPTLTLDALAARTGTDTRRRRFAASTLPVRAVE